MESAHWMPTATPNLYPLQGGTAWIIEGVYYGWRNQALNGQT
jgi:hypothetical protein